MGQYYKPMNTKDKEWLYSHDYDNGLKLMEHSYIGNKFVGTIMKLMVKGGAWFKKPIVWVGDYYGDEGTEEINYYDQCSDSSKIRPTEFMDEKEQKKAILVNHTKKLYLKYSEILFDEEWVINPLPLLTNLGNQRGGGDYYGLNSEKVGIWANDILSIQKTVPKGKGFKKFVVNFENDY